MPSGIVTDVVTEAESVPESLAGWLESCTKWRWSTTGVTKVARQRIVAFTCWLNA